MSNTSRTLRVGRAFTKTPLARQHARAEARGREGRSVRRIPWTTFDRSRYPEPALALLLDAMTGLARGEYSAVDSFARLASALAQNGAPFDIVSAATQIPTDEIRHTEYALKMASLIAGEDVRVEFDPALFAAGWPTGGSMEELDAMMLELPTISETLAAALIDACRERATDPVTKALFSAIMADEVHHLRLGWYYFAWRAPQWNDAERQRAADAAGHMIVHVERQFWQGRDAERGSAKAAAALGVLDSKTQRAVVRRVMEHEVIPGLDALGLGASHAWRVRFRGKG